MIAKDNKNQKIFNQPIFIDERIKEMKSQMRIK